jgi:hypothetical protein
MTAKTTTNRNCPIPNEGGSPPAEAVVFIEINLHHKVASHLAGAQRPTLCVQILENICWSFRISEIRYERAMVKRGRFIGVADLSSRALPEPLASGYDIIEAVMCVDTAAPLCTITRRNNARSLLHL